MQAPYPSARTPFLCRETLHSDDKFLQIFWPCPFSNPIAINFLRSPQLLRGGSEINHPSREPKLWEPEAISLALVSACILFRITAASYRDCPGSVEICHPLDRGAPSCEACLRSCSLYPSKPTPLQSCIFVSFHACMLLC